MPNNSESDVRREKALILSGGKSRPGTGSLHPVAIGAVAEATKPLKPLMKRVALGDSASMQAVTKVNVEQASKRIMQELTRRHFGESRMPNGRVRANEPMGPAGVLTTACRHRGLDATRETPAVITQGAVNWQLVRARPGPSGVAERPVLPMKPGNAGRGVLGINGTENRVKATSVLQIVRRDYDNRVLGEDKFYD